VNLKNILVLGLIDNQGSNSPSKEIATTQAVHGSGKE